MSLNKDNQIANGFIALLDEPQAELKKYALEQLDKIVPDFWADISYAIQKIELLWEDEKFASRSLAALVASKVFYYLEQYETSMKFALRAGKLFDVTHKNEYVETIVAKFIDEYIRLRKENYEKGEVKIDQDLTSIVEGMFQRCFEDKQYKQALGIAIESRRIDKIEQAILDSPNILDMIKYTYNVSIRLVQSRDFRRTVLSKLVELSYKQKKPDYKNLFSILVHLDDHEKVVGVLASLVDSKEEEDQLLALQLAFDLVEISSQRFLSQVREAFLANKQIDTEELKELRTSLSEILSGEKSMDLYLRFLNWHNNSDLAILEQIKEALQPRNTICHNATVIANALMHAGTTRDTFLRNNLRWLAKATNWAKFTATAGLGVIHKGHIKEGIKLLQPYLPPQGNSPYANGGALYALGLVHANNGTTEIIEYLKNALDTSKNEVIQHGGCLGLGLAAMATGNEQIIEDLKSNVLYTDNAVSGEAAGIAMGLVGMGLGNTNSAENFLRDMLTYAHQTTHEKIIRGLAIGMSLFMLGREEEADTLIEQLCSDKDPILRYGGMYTIGMSYSGTGNNNAVRKLLHIAVSDVSDDVRRAAVINLGFVLLQEPEQVPLLLTSLSKSYNPHVRYGAAMAVGIACSGTNLPEAINLLEPLLKDQTDFVRQGAMIATAMVFIQISKAQHIKVEAFRQLLTRRIETKGEPVMSKFGAILASGLLDASGRNATLQLQSSSGHKNFPAIVGMALFTQYWYWYPLIHFVALSFRPTAIIGITKELGIPKWEFKSNARPSLFAYPEKVKPPEKKKAEKVSTAILSTTKKQQERDKRKKEDKEGGNNMDTSSNLTISSSTNLTVNPEKPKEPENSEPKPPVEKKPEPKEEVLKNPARVTPLQLNCISFNVSDRFSPLPSHSSKSFGILLLRDSKPELPTEFVEGNQSVEQTSEVPLPKPFEYIDD